MGYARSVRDEGDSQHVNIIDNEPIWWMRQLLRKMSDMRWWRLESDEWRFGREKWEWENFPSIIEICNMKCACFTQTIIVWQRPTCVSVGALHFLWAWKAKRSVSAKAYRPGKWVSEQVNVWAWGGFFFEFSEIKVYGWKGKVQCRVRLAVRSDEVRIILVFNFSPDFHVQCAVE